MELELSDDANRVVLSFFAPWPWSIFCVHDLDRPVPPEGVPRVVRHHSSTLASVYAADDPRRAPRFQAMFRRLVAQASKPLGVFGAECDLVRQASREWRRQALVLAVCARPEGGQALAEELVRYALHRPRTYCGAQLSWSLLFLAADMVGARGDEARSAVQFFGRKWPKRDGDFAVAHRVRDFLWGGGMSEGNVA